MKTKRLSSGLLVSILAVSASSLVPAATFTSVVAVGDWGNPLSWDVGAGFPNTYAGDSAIISATQTINYDGSIPTLGGNLVVANGNAITINGGTLQQTWAPGVPPPFGTTVAIGLSSAGTGVGTLNINAGGSFISGTANTVVVGVSVAALGGGAASGTVNVNEGTMTLSGAASGSSGGQGLAIGVNAAGAGVLNVGDAVGAADSSLVDLATNNVTLTVGGTNGEGAGTGTVNIKTDGRVATGTARAYVGDGGTGTLLVDGGTLAIGVGGLTVGNNGGTGNLNVSSGLATIDGPGGAESFQVGAGTGSIGNVSVTGGTLNSVNNMLIGVNGGIGQVTQTGGAVSFGGWMAIGYGAGAGGSSYNISGGSLTGNGGAPLEVGADRAGSMSISGTATVNVDKIAVGIRNNGNGTLNISGGTTTTKFLAVAGDQGGATHTGVVNITGGVNTIAPGAGQSYLGRQAGSTGTLNLNGGALTNASGQDFHIGFEGGTGNLNITNGGTFTHNWWVNVARSAGSSGQITVSGAGSSLVVNGGGDAHTNIGENGVGSMTITNGGAFTTQSELAVGRFGGSTGNVLLGGAGSSISLTGGDRHFYVGQGGSGTFSQSGGTLNLNGNRVQIAEEGGSIGVVNLTGGQVQNSQWFHVGSGVGANGTLNVNYTIPTDTLTTGAFYVGNNGATGALNIISGVVTANNVAEIGRGGGTGNYNQSGGSLSVGGLFALGIGGTGLGDISGGTTSSGGDFRVGDGGGTGTLNISGTASITANGEFQVGNGLGNGTVNMSGGNILANSWVAIGRDGGSGVFNLSGGTFTKGAGNGTFDIGTFGNGATPASGILNQTGGSIVNTVSTTNVARDNSGSGVWNMFGGTATLAQLSVGNEGVGTLTMDGVGTNLTAAGESYVGNGGGGRGTLTIRNGAEAHFNGGWSSKIGNNTGSVGTMNLESGGKYLTNNSWTVIASEPGSTGVVNISDDTNAGTLLDNSGGEGRLVVGRFGNATVNQSGGTVRTGNWFVIGLDPGSSGTYNFSGGNIDTSGNYDIGKSGTGVMNITHGNAAGTTLTAGGGGTPNQINVGTEGGSNGTLSISLANATDRIKSRELFTGNGGGTVGLINLSKGILQTNEWVEIGRNGGTGTLNVSGAESKWERGTVTGSRQDVQIGYNGGNGTVNVSDGGTVNHNWWFNLARGAGSTGTMTIDGANSTVNVVSSGDNGAQTNIGENGTGTMTITNGGVFNHMMAVGVGGANVGGGEVHIAREGGSVGTLTVSNPNSAFNSKSREFRVGNNGSGTLNITDGGVVNFTSVRENGVNADGNFGIGHGGNASGTINMDNGTLNVSAWALFAAWDGVASTANINMTNSTINVLAHNYIDGGGNPGVGGHLFFGDTGTAIINQEGGAINAQGWSAIGRERGGNATYNLGVGGGGGAFNVGGAGGNELYVGRQSTGTINMGVGTSVISTGLIGLGRDTALSNGTINNNGGYVQSGADFDVGRNSIGTYRQTAGQLQVNGSANIAHEGNGNGIFEITGGTATINNNFDVANGGGDATALIDGGATVNVGAFYAGTGAGSVAIVNIANGTLNLAGWSEIGRFGGSATVNIVGSNALFDGSFDDMQIGHQGGTGNVNILDGGKMTHNWWINLGRDNGTGNMLVDGVGSKVTQGTRNDSQDSRLNIGGDPNNGGTINSGVLTISNGGVFERTSNGGDTSIGRNVNNNGTVNISTGGRLTSVGGEVNVGVNGGTGTVNISGAGSIFLSATGGGDFFHRVGQGGGATGTMNITDGGEWHNNGWFTISQDGATGNVNVDGVGSKLTTTNGLIIGWSGNGTGTLTVSNDAVVNSTGREVSIGRDFNGNLANSPKGIVNLLSGGTLNGVNLRIGHNTTGTVNIDGGKLNSTGGWAIVADGGSSLGVINMSSGEINTTDSMFVGMQGAANGTINQTGGATNIGNELSIGRAGSTGNVAISGGTFNVNGWTVVGGGRDGGGGIGTLSVTDGAKFTHLQTGGDLLAGWQAGSQSTINISSGGSIIYNWWARFGLDAGSTSVMNISGAGSKFEQGTVDGDTRFYLGEGSQATLNLSDNGLLKIRKGLTVGGSQDEAGRLGTGNVNVDGGHIKVGGEINFGWRAGATGNITINGGTVTNNSWFIVGRGGAGNYTQNGGRVWNTAQELRVGNDAGGNGVMIVNGGSFNSFSHGMIGEGGSGTLTMNGGIVGMGCADGSNLFIGHLGGSTGFVNMLGGYLDVNHGSLEFNTNATATNATLNLAGGIVSTRFLNNPTGNGVAQINANGGTLQAARNEADFIRGFSSAQLSLGGNLTLDSNSFTVTVNSVFSGAGGLTKGGFGQLNLTNNQVYTGDTGVTSGILNLDFTASASPNNLVPNSGLVLGGGTLRVTTSATLANAQSFTGTTINSGSSRVEVVENGGAGTVNLGAITRNAGGTVDVGVVGTVTTTDVNVNGILGKGLTVNGNDWAKNNGADKIVAALPGDYAATFGAANNLDVTAAITGGGSVNSIKAAANITLDANTTIASGGILIPSTAGNVTIASTAGETLTSGNNLDLVVIQNSAAGTAAIASQITGAGIALTKSGPGTLVLANPTNSYDGGTFINAGAVVIGADSALGNVNGGITFAGATLGTSGILAVLDTMTLAPTRAITINSGGGGFSVPSGKTLTISQDITGAGGLGKVGSGTLILGGNNSYTGATGIFEGSLVVNGTLGSTGGFIADGDLTLGAGSAINSTGTFEIARNAGPTVTVTGVDTSISGTEFTIGGAGNATVTLTGASTLAASCDLFVARLNGSTSSLTVTGGNVIAQNDMFIGAAGGATGTASVSNGSLSVGQGLIVGNGGGSGTLNLSGTTTGSFGILAVGNGGSGTVNIADSATLSGSTAGASGYINIGINNPGVVGSAVVNQSGGAVTFNSWMTIGIEGGSSDPANAQYNISAGTLSGAGIEAGSDHGGTLDISGTAVVNVPSLSIGTYGNRGAGNAGNGVVNVSGGGTLTTTEINVGHNANNGGMTSGGVLNLSGGLTTVNGTVFVARNGGGGSSIGTVNFNGGELRTNAIARGAGSSAQLNFNGTIIVPNANSGDFITGFDATSSEVLAGGAIFNTNGKLITLSTSLDGVGGLTKAGAGTMTLTGTNTYAGGTNITAGTLEVGNGGLTGSLGTGPVTNDGTLKFNRSDALNVPGAIGGAGPIEQNGTGTTTLGGISGTTAAIAVNAGTLAVNGSISGSTTTVNVNGTVSGTGTLGTLIINGGTLAPGASPGLLNSGNVTFNGGTFSVEINGTTVGSLYDQLNVTGSVTLQSNTALVINFGYAHAFGDSFSIINNDALDAIVGGGLFTYLGTPLADGDIFIDFGDSTALMIDYTGGTDNNDVVLSVVPEPGAVTMLLGGIGLLLGGQRFRRRK